MTVLARILSPVCVSHSIHGRYIDNSNNTRNTISFSPILHYSNSTSCSRFSGTRIRAQFAPKASSSSSIAPTGEEYIEEATTNVKFQSSLILPGCSVSPLSLLGIGYREKVFAIIGVKVYAAGFYVNESILTKLADSKGDDATGSGNQLALFRSIYQDPLEKSLQIVLVRDVDGKTFWDALDEAISPRITKTTPGEDESAMATFRAIFQGRPLKKGTFIFLTWLEPSKMLVSVSSNGLPTKVDATIESTNVSWALFNVFFGDAPVSPSLKASVTNGIAMILN